MKKVTIFPQIRTSHHSTEHSFFLVRKEIKQVPVCVLKNREEHSNGLARARENLKKNTNIFDKHMINIPCGKKLRIWKKGRGYQLSVHSAPIITITTFVHLKSEIKNWITMHCMPRKLNPKLIFKHWITRPYKPNKLHQTWHIFFRSSTM